MTRRQPVVARRLTTVRASARTTPGPPLETVLCDLRVSALLPIRFTRRDSDMGKVWLALPLLCGWYVLGRADDFALRDGDTVVFLATAQK